MFRVRYNCGVSSPFYYRIYLLFSTIITPYALNKSRNLIKQSGVDTVSNLLKPNIFADTFKGLTFYIGEKNNNMIKDIFIKDDGNNLSSLLPEENTLPKNKTVIAKTGIISKKTASRKISRISKKI